MKRTPIDNIPDPLPCELADFLRGSPLYDSSCSPEARVYFIDRDEGYFLKKSARGTLALEAEMTSYFHKKGIGAEVLSYINGDSDWLLTKKVAGEDCTHRMYLSDPKRMCDVIAERLRALHELDYTDCPVSDRIGSYLATVDENYRTGNYDKTHFPDSFGYRSADEAYAVLTQGRSELKCEVLIHGDYCLPNIMLDNWKFSSFIDLGNGGVGDRHIDIFWGVWTLGFNLGTDRYRDRFLDAYGRDKVDEGKLSIVAAAEVFG